MRVIAGSVGGRRLAVPKGHDTRPTPERVREALFSALAPTLPGAHVLDLFAGSGALGIEALSRGADRAVMVERDPRAARVIERNLTDLGLEGGDVRVDDAARFCRSTRDGPFDVVVADPPYDVPWGDVAGMLAALAASGGLAPGATVVVERRAGQDVPEGEASVAWTRIRSYGDTVLLWGQAKEDQS